MGCCHDKPRANQLMADYKMRSEKDKIQAGDRVKGEFAMLRNVIQSNYHNNVSESVQIIKEYYQSRQNCQAIKGYPCKYEGWCVFCD